MAATVASLIAGSVTPFGTWRAGRSALAPFWALVLLGSRSAIDGQIRQIWRVKTVRVARLIVSADGSLRRVTVRVAVVVLCASLIRRFGATPTGRPRRAFGDTVDASRDWTPARQAREKDEHGASLLPNELPTWSREATSLRHGQWPRREQSQSVG
jgi:hypothetical protein